MRTLARASRRGWTLLEVLFVIVLMFIMLGVVFSWFQAGTKSVVTTTDHAQAREDAITVLSVIQKDLDRLVIDDMITSDNVVENFEDFPSVFKPIRIFNAPQAGKFAFFAFHHRRFFKSEARMELVGHFIEYKVVKLPPDANGNPQGVDLLRNDKVINPAPLEDVIFQPIDKVKAGQIGLSPFHAFEVEIHPRRQWDQRANQIRKIPPIRQLFHLKGIESQYACLLSLKRANAPYSGLEQVKELPPESEIFQKYNLYDVPMDWIRPVGLISIDPNTLFDDATVNQHEDLP